MRAALARLQQLAPSGPAPSSNADEPIYLWPCNVPTWHHWWALQSQWRQGHAGVTGMDYAGVRAYLDEQGLAGPERQAIFAGLRACEQATLDVLAEQRDKQPKP